jgi:hypothetical protein
MGTCVGQQLRCEIIEGLQFRDRFQEFRHVCWPPLSSRSARLRFTEDEQLHQAKWVQACGGGLRCQREVQHRLNRLIARWHLKHLLEAAAGRTPVHQNSSSQKRFERHHQGLWQRSNRCAGSAAAGYVLVTQTFPQAQNNIIARNHATNILSHPGGISRQLELAEPPAPRLPLFLEARATTQAAYRDLRVAHVRGPPRQTGGTDSDIDVLCDTGFLPAPQLNLTTYSAPSRVSDPADWDEDLKIGRTLETGPEIVFAPRVKLRPPRVLFLVECGPIERGTR